jgi:hypothetical protein
MFRAIAPLLLVLAPVPSRALAQPSALRVADQPARVIPFELHENRIYLQVSGPGFGPRWFLLDSGAQATHFTSELVREAGLRTAGRVGISGVGTGRIRGAYVAPTTLTIGGLQLPVRRGVSGPAEAVFGSIFSGSGRRFDGVLGYDLFAAYSVQIDYRGRQLRLYRPGGHPRSSTAETLPIRIVDKKPYATAMIPVGGKTLSANLHLDIGFGGALALNSGFVASEGLLQRVGPTLQSTMGGVGGVSGSRTGRLEAVMLGRLRIMRPVAVMALVQGAGVRRDSDGWIGGDLLRRFTVTIDYRTRTVMLDPNAALSEPFEADMSGLGLAWEGQRGILVSSVAEATPGAEAGVQRGDRLIAVDGVSAGTRTMEEIRRLLRREGEERELLLQRDGQQVRARFRLRRRL